MSSGQIVLFFYLLLISIYFVRLDQQCIDLVYLFMDTVELLIKPQSNYLL